VGSALGHVLAGHAGTVRQVQDDAQALYSLASAGVWDRVLADLLKDRENRYVMIDSNGVREHQQAATARKKGSGERSGRSRGGLTTKIHLLADEPGLPIGFVLTDG